MIRTNLLPATRAAGALALQDTLGVIAIGRPADFVPWNVQEAAELACWFGGQRPVRAVVRQEHIVGGDRSADLLPNA